MKHYLFRILLVFCLISAMYNNSDNNISMNILLPKYISKNNKNIKISKSAYDGNSIKLESANKENPMSFVRFAKSRNKFKNPFTVVQTYPKQIIKLSKDRFLNDGDPTTFTPYYINKYEDYVISYFSSHYGTVNKFDFMSFSTDLCLFNHVQDPSECLQLIKGHSMKIIEVTVNLVGFLFSGLVTFTQPKQIYINVFACLSLSFAFSNLIISIMIVYGLTELQSEPLELQFFGIHKITYYLYIEDWLLIVTISTWLISYVLLVNYWINDGNKCIEKTEILTDKIKDTFTTMQLPEGKEIYCRTSRSWNKYFSYIIYITSIYLLIDTYSLNEKINAENIYVTYENKNYYRSISNLNENVIKDYQKRHDNIELNNQKCLFQLNQDCDDKTDQTTT